MPNPMSATQFLSELERHRGRRLGPVRGDAQTEALVDSILEGRPEAGPKPGPQPGPPKAYRVIKLGIDVHAERYVVVRQIDGATPQPAQAFSPKEFVLWAKSRPNGPSGCIAATKPPRDHPG